MLEPRGTANWHTLIYRASCSNIPPSERYSVGWIKHRKLCSNARDHLLLLHLQASAALASAAVWQSASPPLILPLSLTLILTLTPSNRITKTS